MKKTLVLCLSTFSAICFSSEFTQIEWNDLKPTQVQDHIALPDLNYQQRFTLQQIFTLSEYNDTNNKAELARLKAELQRQGLDADHLLQLREQYIAAQKKAAETVTSAFDGQKVRIPGFLVPIQFSSPLVATDFLLVPTAGACIHMPPPPANQIVRITYPEGYQVETVQYPVWVEGVISSKLVTDNVYLVDGDTDVVMGYSMSASSVVNYH